MKRSRRKLIIKGFLGISVLTTLCVIGVAIVAIFSNAGCGMYGYNEDKSAPQVATINSYPAPASGMMRHSAPDEMEMAEDSSTDFGYDDMEDENWAAKETPYDTPNKPEPAPDTTKKPDTNEEQPDAQERKRIYRGWLSIGCYDIELKMTEAKHAVLAVGGYIQEEQTTAIVLRVPIEKFHEVFEQLQGLGRVIDKNISAIDVTELFYDIQLRVEIKKKYLEMLRLYLKGVTDVKEKIRVMMLISQIAEEINIMEAQLRYLADQVSYSTITINFSLEQDSTRSRYARYTPPVEWVDDPGVKSLLSDD